MALDASQQTFDRVIRRMISEIPDDIDTRQGSVAYVMLAPAARELEYLYAVVSEAGMLALLPTSVGEYLDKWGWTVGVERILATPAQYEAIFTGTTPRIGTRFFVSPRRYFQVAQDPDDPDRLLFVAEDTGAQTNDIVSGTAATAVEFIQGLESATFGGLLVPGVDEETDNALRERIHEKLAGPAENGNAQHYKTWCESVAGVGRAKIIPLFAGENTVMAVLFDPEGAPCAQSVVDAVQEYIDPITAEKTVLYNGEEVIVGDGCGDGKANIGAHFLAVAAGRTEVVVTFDAIPKSDATLAQVQTQATEVISAYLKRLALQSVDSDGTTIRLNTIGAMLMDLPALLDYDNLLLNGNAQNISIPLTNAPVLKVVTANAAI